MFWSCIFQSEHHLVKLIGLYPHNKPHRQTLKEPPSSECWEYFFSVGWQFLLNFFLFPWLCHWAPCRVISPSSSPAAWHYPEILQLNSVSYILLRTVGNWELFLNHILQIENKSWRIDFENYTGALQPPCWQGKLEELSEDAMLPLLTLPFCTIIHYLFFFTFSIKLSVNSQEIECDGDVDLKINQITIPTNLDKLD